MGTFALTDVTTWVHGYDFTTDLNQVTLKTSVDDLDNTTFRSTYRSRVGGLKDVDLTLNGYWTDTADAAGFGALGGASRPVTISPTGSAGDVAYMAQLGGFSYELGNKIGDLLPFSLEAMATNKYGLVRGRVAADNATVTAPGALGVPLNLGSVGATQHIYAAIHVFSPGASITLHVQTDNTADFASPTDFGSPVTITAAGGVWFPRIPGSIGDTWVRLNVTDVSGTFALSAAIAVQ